MLLYMLIVREFDFYAVSELGKVSFGGDSALNHEDPNCRVKTPALCNKIGMNQENRMYL